MKPQPEPRYDEDGEQLCVVPTCEQVGRLSCPCCDAWVCNDHDRYEHSWECGEWLERQEAQAERDRIADEREWARDVAPDRWR